MCILCPDKPPNQVKSRNQQKAAEFGALMMMQGYPNTFAVGLQAVCCMEPLCCCMSSLGTMAFGMTACWARSKVLDTYYNGSADYTCCQGYIGGCCWCALKLPSTPREARDMAG